MEQYDKVADSLSITVRFVTGQIETFTSFARFDYHAKSFTVAVESVEFSYDFLIHLPQTKEAKNYKLEISLESAVGIKEALESRKAGDFERLLMQSFLSNTGRVSIDYIDYAVARSVEAAVVGWYNGLHFSPDPKWAKLLHSASAYFPITLYCASVCIVTAIVLTYFVPLVADVESLFAAGSYSALLYLLLCPLGRQAGAFARQKVREVRPLSYINLGSGDQKAIVKMQRSIRAPNRTA
jgi:hypothetical protein